MLRITMNKSASGAKKYYAEEYYSEGHQDAGKWGGKGAEKLGLSGIIMKKDFANLCDNQHPLTSNTLTGRKDKDRTVGYDFTFNASKSVSLAYTFGSEDDKRIILDAFEQSVRETMTEVETGMQARVRVKGKNENRLTGNIAYGAFTHFTTRPIDGVPDPHLHSHCFVFNATHDQEENKWKAGQFQQIKQDAPYYEALFHSTLAHRLQQAGYGIERTKNGFELAGIDKRTIATFSRRTKEIEDYARDHNITDEKKKSQVGSKTREAKRPTPSGSQQEQEWRQRLTPDDLHALHNLRHTNTKDNDAHAAGRALQFSLNHHLERKSVASDKEILATAIKSSIGETTPQQVKKTFDNDTDILVAHEHLRTFITTKDALKEEQQLIMHCMEARNKFRPIHETYEPKNPQLNDQQKAAVRYALSSTDGINIITGKAGTGKTTLMKEVQQGILESGKQIFSFAPSSEASRGVQRSEGFDNADTVAKLIQDEKLHPHLKHQVIWIDEAGMLSNRDINQVLTIAHAQRARVILSGDTKQHTSVERGDALRIIQQETDIKSVTVSKIQRQKNAEYKEAVHLLSEGRTEKGFNTLDRLGSIHEITDPQERMHAIAQDYCRSAHNGHQPKDVLVVAPTHAEGSIVTDHIRQHLKEKKIIGQEEHSYSVLKNRQLTEAEKQRAESYHLGDVIAFHQHSKGVKAGSKLEVMHANENGLVAKDANEVNHNVALSEAKKFSVYEPRQVSVAEGDKIRITANSKSNDGKHLFNGSSYRIDGFDKQGNIALSNGSTISPDFGHFNLGYVSTSHASQGKTVDKVIISQSSATFRAASAEQFYVSVSRGKEAVSIYTDDKKELLASVSQSAERTSATELVAKQQRQMQEAARQSHIRQQQQQEKPADTKPYLTSKTSNDGLQTATRTEQNEAHR